MNGPSLDVPLLDLRARGQVAEEDGDVYKALARYRKAVKVDITHVPSHERIIELHMSLNQFSEAMEARRVLRVMKGGED